MRLCASLFRRRRGPAGLRDLLQLGDVAVFSLCAQYFLNVRGGGGITTRFGNPAWPGFKTANFALLGLGRGYSRRTQKACGTAMRMMRVAVPRRRGPAGLRDLFRFCRNCGLYALRSGLSACAKHGWYHYPQRALRAVETPDGRLPKGLICRFLRSGGRSSPHDSYFLANTQNFLLAVPVANAFALWYDIIFSHLPSLGNAGGY